MLEAVDLKRDDPDREQAAFLVQAWKAARATPYVTDLQAADPDNDGYVNKTEFMDACKKGLVHSASRGTAIPKSSHVMLRKR